MYIRDGSISRLAATQETKRARLSGIGRQIKIIYTFILTSAGSECIAFDQFVAIARAKSVIESNVDNKSNEPFCTSMQSRDSKAGRLWTMIGSLTAKNNLKSLLLGQSCSAAQCSNAKRLKVLVQKCFSFKNN